MHLCDHCMTVAGGVCVNFQSVHVVIENGNTLHMPSILVVSYQVYGASSLATFKGVYGTVWDCERTVYT